MNREEMKMAWDALENIKMFFDLNQTNRHGLEIAQKMLMEQMQAEEKPACRLRISGANHEEKADQK